MAIKEVKRYWESCQLDYVKEFLCHTEKDVENLPECCVGSKAYVTETGNWYACGKDQTWKLEEEATEEGGTGGGAYIPTGGVSYIEGYRISASSGAVSENAATDLTDFIAVSIGDKVEMYGMVMPARTANVGVHFYAEDKTTKLLSVVGWDGASGFPGVDWEYTMQGDNVTMFVVPDWTEIQDVAYMRIVASDITDKSAIVVSHNEQGGGASLPAAAPYQQLVTDGEGKWVAEKRLAWKEGEKVEITWNGNTEGLTVASKTLYKVSDLVVSDEMIKNGTVTVKSDYGDMTVNVVDLWDELTQAGFVTEDSVLVVVDNQPGMLFARKDNAELAGVVAPEKGVYFVKLSIADYISSFISSSETIHPIPAEYLPAGFVPTAVIKASNYDNALAGVATVKEESVTYECVNMTFEEAYKHVANGGAIMVVTMYVQAEAGLPIIERAQTIINVTAFEGEPALSAGTDNLPLLWKESGITLADV